MINQKLLPTRPNSIPLGLLAIPTLVLFISLIIANVSFASQPTRTAEDILKFDEYQDITKAYKNAIENKRDAAYDQLKIERSLELIKKQLESLQREELMMLKDLNQKNKQLADANNKDERKEAKKKLLSIEKDLLELIDTIRINRKKMMDTEKDLESAKNRLQSSLEKIEAIENYIQSF